MAMALMILSKTQYAYADEEEVQEISDDKYIHINSFNNDFDMYDKDLPADQLTVEVSEETSVEHFSEESQALYTNNGSTISHGNFSEYLLQTGDYKAYAVELSSGDYLQARLLTPNNTNIDYDLVFYDSSFAFIKSSDYYTYINDNGTLAEMVGYKALADEVVYMVVVSGGGGSDTEAYTLDYTIITNFLDNHEPNENAKEAKELAIGTNGVNVSHYLYSPIDNDWYVFTIPDGATYSKIRVTVDADSSINRCGFEIYKNLGSNSNYAMLLHGWGNGGELELPAGTYYIRVVSTNSFNDFNFSDIPTYKLSVAPVPKVNGVQITKFSGPEAGEDVFYPYGEHWRISENKEGPDYVEVYGWAYWEDSIGNKTSVENVLVKVTVENQQLKDRGKLDEAVTSASVVTGSNGFFKVTVWLNPACGDLLFDGPYTVHHYDLMKVILQPTFDSTISDTNYFYYLKKTIDS